MQPFPGCYFYKCAHLIAARSPGLARPWASSLGKPAGSLITTKDHLVKPRHQRALARALGATIEEIDADHLAALVNPTAYIAATLRLIDAVTA